MEKMGEKDPIFQHVVPCVIGSLRKGLDRCFIPQKILKFIFSEGTKIGSIDETDLNLALDKSKCEEYKKYLEFEEDHQGIKIIDIPNMEVPQELEQYSKQVDGHKEFDIKKYFLNFIKLIYEVVSDPENSFEGVSLSTDFTPCEICKNTDQIEPMFVRCIHQPWCKEEDQDKHRENCDCIAFFPPSLTHSKIGCVLHLQFDATKCPINHDKGVRSK